MDDVEFEYTVGMDREAVETALVDGNTAVLALASDDDAYAIPVSYRYDGERILVRLGVGEASAKMGYLERTDTATLVCYGADPEVEGAEVWRDSWSVVARGHLRRVEDELDDAAVNELFPTPIRVFSEPVDDMEVRVYEFVADELTGRRTPR